MESEYFAMNTALEAQAARDADAVVVITRALGDEMVRRGVSAEKMTLVPNGVDVGRFVPRPRDEALAARLGLGHKRVIGYVGSIVDYEGLDLLMHAVLKLHQRGHRDVAALIVGDGVVLESLKQLAKQLEIDRHVIFTGRVPHHDVEAHYSLIDIAPFPRKSLPVTEMVSPLKPLEAMAMNKIVVASDVAALAEMIEPGVNGFTFRKDDVDNMTDVLERALQGRDVPTHPRTWVETNRSWSQLAKKVVEIYDRLTA
jgi:glycosyltransferase involved in cell wall biosynthesis